MPLRTKNQTDCPPQSPTVVSRAEQGDFAYDQTHYVSCNLVWAPTPHFYVGLEYLYGLKEALNGNTGDDHRLQLSLQYKLIR